MKAKRDIGQDYLDKIGINPPGESKGLYFQYEKKFGETVGRGMLSDLYRKIRESGSNENYLAEFYEMKNASLDGALIFNGGYQGDAYRQLCNWIMDNHDALGRDILDIGCECGVMTCFLAEALPDAQITAVDRSASAIKAASELAKRLGLTNISFIHADIRELEGKQYDTVVCMRMLQENCDLDSVMQQYQLLKKEANDFSENIDPFARAVCGCVKDGGFLISSERTDVDPVYLGWLQKVNELGFTLVPGSYREIECREMENKGHLQSFIMQKIGADDPVEVYRFWCACQVAHTQLAKDDVFNGWYADMELQNFGKDIIDGFLLEDPDGNPLLTYSVWSYKDELNLVMLYQAMDDEHILSLYSSKATDELVSTIESMKKEYEAQGAVARELELRDGEIAVRK